MNNQSKYQCSVFLKNKKEFKEHLKKLISKYGKNNIPTEKICNFKFKWAYKSI